MTTHLSKSVSMARHGDGVWGRSDIHCGIFVGAKPPYASSRLVQGLRPCDDATSPRGWQSSTHKHRLRWYHSGLVGSVGLSHRNAAMQEMKSRPYVHRWATFPVFKMQRPGRQLNYRSPASVCVNVIASILSLHLLCITARRESKLPAPTLFFFYIGATVSA